MKILIVGASGLLAKPVIRRLDEAGFQLCLFSRSVKPAMFSKDYEMVQGDLFNRDQLEKAVEGCEAIHISVSTEDEDKAVESIVTVAKEQKINRISMVSGCTVSEENRWFSFVDKKFRSEQMIINSGIPYFIFRPTWFFESLALMVRNGKATVIGKQPNRYHWVSADDFGRMVAQAYSGKGTANGIYYVYGPEKHGMKELLERYCREFHPEIEKVSVAPIPLLRIIALMNGSSQLKQAIALFSYFEKVQEPVIPEEELALLGRPEMDFEAWIASKKKDQNERLQK